MVLLNLIQKPFEYATWFPSQCKRYAFCFAMHVYVTVIHRGYEFCVSTFVKLVRNLGSNYRIPEVA